MLCRVRGRLDEPAVVVLERLLHVLVREDLDTRIDGRRVSKAQPESQVRTLGNTLCLHGQSFLALEVTY